MGFIKTVFRKLRHHEPFVPVADQVAGDRVHEPIRPARFGDVLGAIGQDEEKAAKYAEVLYAQALLMADLPLEDPTGYTDLVCSLMQ